MLGLQSPHAAIDWLRSRGCADLEVDSRRIGAGDGFIAWPGAASDGRRFVQDALSRGAAACLVESEGVEDYGFEDEAIACLGGLKEATGPLAAVWYGEPTQAIDLLAVTGTNGKTSTVWWLAQALSGLADDWQVPTGIIGTLGIGLPPGHAPARLVGTGLTTPDPVTLQRCLRRFVDDGLAACAIEASSIGLAERRLDGSRIRIAIFTNFTQDHLDYHGSMAAYWQAKARLFAWPGLQAAVINTDDERGAALADLLAPSSVDLWTVSCTQPARLKASDIDLHANGLGFTVTEEEQRHHVATTLIGSYNVSNLLGVVGTMRAMGVPLESAVQACQSLESVPGRMQRLGAPGQPLVVVDYAHTPDALVKVLGALLPLARGRGGQLCCVFGCGGDRDKTKRPLMAVAAEQLADQIVVTSDNPRSEDPGAIIDQVIAGFKRPKRSTIELDRERAIARAVSNARPEDVVCIAGKGHEAYQEVSGVKHPFSDADHAARALAGRADAATTSAGACQ